MSASGTTEDPTTTGDPTTSATGTTTDETGTTDATGSTTTRGTGRVDDGLLVLYLFDEGKGDLVADQSGVDPALDLTIQEGATVTWGDPGLSIDASSVLLAEDPNDKILDACQTSEGITVEAWVTSSDTAQQGPARIVAFSGGTGEHNFILGQGSFNDPSANFTLRLRTEDTDVRGLPELVATDTVDKSIHHLVATHADDGAESFYVDGAEVATGDRSGSFSAWPEGYDFILANEADGSRPWLGELHLVAVYDRPLTSDEVAQNMDAGF